MTVKMALIVLSVVLFALAAFGLDHVGTLGLVPLGLAVFAGAHL